MSIGVRFHFDAILLPLRLARASSRPRWPSYWSRADRAPHLSHGCTASRNASRVLIMCLDGEGGHRAMVPSELQILVLFYDEGGTHLFARTTYHTEEVDDEGNRCEGPGRGKSRDEAGRAAQAARSDKRRHRSDSCFGIRPD